MGLVRSPPFPFLRFRRTIPLMPFTIAASPWHTLGGHHRQSGPPWLGQGRSAQVAVCPGAVEPCPYRLFVPRACGGGVVRTARLPKAEAMRRVVPKDDMKHLPKRYLRA